MSGDSVVGMSGVAAKRALVIKRAGQRRAAVGDITSAIELDATAFVADLSAHLQKLEVRTEQQLTRTGVQVQNKARSLCPVDTGRLRSSIFMRSGRDGKGFYVEIGTNVSYAAYVEFGTTRMRARPFLLPAVALASGFMRAGV